MMRRAAAAGFLLLFAAVTTAGAQDKAAKITIGAMAVAPLSGSADNFSMGPGVGLGVAWNVREQFGLKFDLAYARLGARDVAVPLLPSPIDVKPGLSFGSAAFVFRGPPGRARLYVLAGAGVYHRSVTLTTSGTGLITVCNPWWFVCYAQAVPVDRIIGSRSTTDAGVNVGFGLSAGAFFADVRYHYMWGPTYDTPTGGQKATGKFLPLTVGVSF